MKKLRRHLSLGLLICIPVLIAYDVFSFITDTLWWIMRPLVELVLTVEILRDFPGWAATLMGIASAVLSLALLGWLAAGPLGRLLVWIAERAFANAPRFNSIYRRLKSLRRQYREGDSPRFRQFVLVHWNANGWLPGFVTSELDWPDQNDQPAPHYAVFIPSTHLISGGIRVVPADRVRFIDCTIDEAAASILSFGITLPEATEKVLPASEAPAHLFAGRD